MSILIFGKNGQVGWELCRSCSVLGAVKSVGSDEVDFKDQDSIVKVIREVNPRFIVNAAAYTDVDRAESEEEVANQVNGIAVGVIAEEAKRIGAHLTHYSTDYVFDGLKSTPYGEEDMPAPLNAYGRSKLLGERYIRDVGVSSVTLRITWVYGRRGKNFYRTMLRLGGEREELRVVGDQNGVPTWSRHVADATAVIIRDCDLLSKSGVYHMTPQGKTNWYEYATEIFSAVRSAAPTVDLKIKKLVRIEAAEYPTPARRPMNSLLENKKIESHFGIKLPEWQDSLRMVIGDS